MPTARGALQNLNTIQRCFTEQARDAAEAHAFDCVQDQPDGFQTLAVGFQGLLDPALLHQQASSRLSSAWANAANPVPSPCAPFMVIFPTLLGDHYPRKTTAWLVDTAS